MTKSKTTAAPAPVKSAARNKPPAKIAGKAKPDAAKAATPPAPATAKPGTAKTTGKPTGGKLGTIVALLSRKEGATIADLTTATGWQAHSVRGAISGGLKKAGHTIERTRIEGVSTYRVRT